MIMKNTTLNAIITQRVYDDEVDSLSGLSFYSHRVQLLEHMYICCYIVMLYLFVECKTCFNSIEKERGA